MTLEEYIAQQNALAGGLPPPAPALQPGLTVPTATIDPLVQPAPEIEMPADVIARPQEIEMPGEVVSRPVVSAPHVPELGAASMPDDEIAAQRAKIDAQLANRPLPGQLQPGLGIPVSTIDQFVPAAAQQEAHEQAVESQVAGSERLSDDPLRAPTPEEAAENRVDASAELPGYRDAFETHDEYAQSLSDEELFRVRREREIEEQLDDQKRQSDLLKRADDEAKAAHKIRLESRRKFQEEQAAIDAQRAELAKQKVGAGDWYREGGIGRTVGAVLISALGGLTQHLNGGRNIGLEAVNNSINRFIAAKQADREHQRAVLGDRGRSLAEKMDRADADAREDEAFAQAALERAKHEIETVQQNFPPESTRAMALEAARRQIDGDLAARQLAAQEALEKKWEGRLRLSWDVEKNQRERDENRRKEEKHALEKRAAELKLAGMQGGGGPGKAKPADVALTPDEWEKQGQARPPVPMTEKQYASWQKLKKGSQDIAANEAGMSREQRENWIPGVVNADGSPFIAAGRAEDVSKKREAVAAAKRMIKRMDDALRTRTGWSSDVGNSDERKKLAAQWGNVLVDAKNLLELGAITQADVPLMEGVVGTSDPSSWKDPTAGILEARRLIEDRVNSSLEAVGYEGPRWQISAPSTKRPEKTPDDYAFQALQSDDVNSYTSFGKDMQDDRLKSERASNEEVRAAHKRGGLPPGLQKTIDKWGADARGPEDDPKARLARERLASLAATDGNGDPVYSPVVNAAARSALESATLAGVAPERVGPSTTSVRDTIAEPKGGR